MEWHIACKGTNKSSKFKGKIQRFAFKKLKKLKDACFSENFSHFTFHFPLFFITFAPYTINK